MSREHRRLGGFDVVFIFQRFSALLLKLKNTQNPKQVEASPQPVGTTTGSVGEEHLLPTFSTELANGDEQPLEDLPTFSPTEPVPLANDDDDPLLYTMENKIMRFFYFFFCSFFIYRQLMMDHPTAGESLFEKLLTLLTSGTFNCNNLTNSMYKLKKVLFLFLFLIFFF